MSFGEGALQRNRRTRAGTIETLTDCFFAVVCADSYDKLLKKHYTFVMNQKVKFLRQIPYISYDWKNKEVEKFVYHCKEINIESRGRIIAKEGNFCDKVYIIAEGEVEIVKTDLNAIFMNYQGGVIGVKE